MINLIIAYIVINPLFMIIGQELRPAQEMFYQLSSMLIIVAGLFFDRRKIKVDSFHYPLVALFGWFVFLHSTHQMGWAIMNNLFLGLGVYITVITTLKPKDIHKVCKALMGMVLFALLYLFLQKLGYDIRSQTIRNSANIANMVAGIPSTSFFGLEAHFGVYLAIATPLMILCAGWLGCLLPIAIVFSHSTGAIMGALVSIFFYYWFRKRLVAIILFVPLLAGLVGYVVFHDNPMGMQKSRIDMWGKVVQDTFEKPFGHGLDSFKGDNREGAIKYFKFKHTDETVRVVRMGNDWIMKRKMAEGEGPPELDYWDHPHNEFVWILYEGGFVGLGMVIWFLIMLWRKFWTSTKSRETTALMAALVVILVTCLTQFPFHVARLGHLVPIILGLFYISVENYGENKVQFGD